jgi:hypothetical protein
MNVSGKLVIISILTLALAAAGISWWFRYTTTHRAVRFWGPGTARLIRDAPIVEFCEYGREANDDYQKLVNRRDISNSPGLIHLRNALLEDRSFKWPAEYGRPGSWGWALVFRDPSGNAATLNFTSDWRYVDSTEGEYIVACEPISSGLEKFVDELPRSAAETPR